MHAPKIRPGTQQKSESEEKGQGQMPPAGRALLSYWPELHEYPLIGVHRPTSGHSPRKIASPRNRCLVGSHGVFIPESVGQRVSVMWAGGWKLISMSPKDPQSLFLSGRYLCLDSYEL